MTDTFNINQGVKQGCSLSSTLFNMFMQILIKELEASKQGIQTEVGRTVPGLLFADDVTLLSETREGLRRLIQIYEEFCGNYRTSTNIDKTKYMVYMKDNRDMHPMELSPQSDSEEEQEDRNNSKKKN